MTVRAFGLGEGGSGVGFRFGFGFGFGVGFGGGSEGHWMIGFPGSDSHEEEKGRCVEARIGGVRLGLGLGFGFGFRVRGNERREESM